MASVSICSNVSSIWIKPSLKAMPNYRLILWGLGFLGTLTCEMQGSPVQAIAFNIQASGSTPDSVISSVSAAGDLWSSYLQDDVVINLNIDFAPLASGVLGRTVASEKTYAYSDIFQTLQSDRTSQQDQIAVSNLSSGSDFDLLINYTSDSPTGYGSPTPYLDDDGGLNNRSIRVTTANAKALNLVAANATDSDATITFTSQVLWDADRTDGVNGDRYDLIGVAAHEIGHALGFISGVDFLDEYSPFSSNQSDFFFPENSFTTVSTLDLFRFSDASLDAGAGIIDWTANATSKYFSINGGNTSLAPFATGINHGDGESVSHWSPDQSIGLMNPRLQQGQQLGISSVDLTAFDVIGWNLSPTATSLSIADTEVTVTDVTQPDILIVTEISTDPSTPLSDSPDLEATPASSPEENSSDGPSDGSVLTGAEPDLPDWMAPVYTLREAESSASEGSIQNTQEVPEPGMTNALWLAIASMSAALGRRRLHWLTPVIQRTSR